MGQLRSMWAVGSITPLTLYWKQGMGDWLPLGSFLEVPNSEPVAPIQQPPPTLPAFKSSPRNSKELFPSFSSPPKKLPYSKLFPPPEEKITPKVEPTAVETTADQKNTKSDEFGVCGCSIGCLGSLAFLACIYYAIFTADTTGEKVFAIVASLVAMIIFGSLAQLVDGFFKNKKKQKKEKSLEVIAKRLDEEKRLQAEEESKLPSDPLERAWILHRKDIAHKLYSLEKEAFEKEDFRLRWEGDRGPWKNYTTGYSAHSWGFPGHNEWQANYLARSVARQFTLDFPGATVKFYNFEDKRSNIETYSKYVERETDPYEKHAQKRMLVLMKEAQADIRFAIKEFFADEEYLTSQASADTIREIMKIVEPYGWPDFDGKMPGHPSTKDVFLDRLSEIECLPPVVKVFDENAPRDLLNIRDSDGVYMFEETWRYGRRHVKSRFPMPHIFPSSGFIG